MAKHRGGVFVVVREAFTGIGTDEKPVYTLSGIVGVYYSVQRADEIAARYAQELRDSGFSVNEFKFSVQVSTYYDE